MTDLLAERFAAFTEPANGDWLDVQRRARGSRRPLAVIAAAAVAACLLAAVALAAGGWLFSKTGDTVQARTTVAFHGATYTLGADVVVGGRTLILTLARGTKAVAYAGGNYVLAAPGVAPEPALPNPPAPSGPPALGMAYTQGRGEILFGDARPGIGRIEITDDRGHTTATDTAAAPVKLSSAFRLWILALPTSHAKTISVYNQHGQLISRTPFYPRTNLSLH